MSPRPERAVLLVVVVAVALRLILAAIVDLGMDEAYAVAVSRQFQLSWYDHPPMVFWIVGAMQAAFGPYVPDPVLRLPFIALSAGTTWLLFRLTAMHFGKAAGLWAALMFTVAPFFFLSAGSWLVPDGPLIFFLALAAVALSRIVLDYGRSGRWREWLIAGAALGLALLSKYHAALFGLGVALYFLASARHRFWFTLPQPYVAAALAFGLFLPVIVWNAQNEWVSFAFQLGRNTDAATGATRVAVLFALEALYLLPTTALLLIAAAVWALRPKGNNRQSAAFFLALGLPAILVLDLLRFWSADSFPHWSMPGWLFLMPLAGAMLVALAARMPMLARSLAGVSVALFAVLLAAVILLVSDWRLEGVVPGMDAFRVEAGSWSGVAEGINAAGVLREDLVLMADSWRDASRVVEALRVPLPMLALEADPHGFAWVDQQAMLGRDALIVTRSWESEGLLRNFAPHFESFETIGSWPTEPGNRHLMDVTLARGFHTPFPEPYGPD